MATSGTKTFTLDTAQIIEEASERIGGAPISGEEAQSARTSLNLLLTHLNNLSAPLSSQELKTLSTTVDTPSYTLPDDIINVLNLVISDDSGKDIELDRDDMFEYNRMYDKQQSGRPNMFFIERTRDGLVMWFWPRPDKVYTVKYWGTSKIEDVAAATNNIDIPVTYLPAIISGLSYYMSLKRRNIDAPYRQELKTLYAEELKAALEEDRTRVDYFVRGKINSGR